LTEKGERVSPFFKPGYDYTRLLAQNYFNHLTVFNFNKVVELGGLDPECEGSQDYDLVLRYIDAYVTADRLQVKHIDRILYHWRASEGSVAKDPYAKPYALESARKAVKSHLLRKNQIAFVGPLPAAPIWNSVRPMVIDSDKKMVSIIIPFKDKVEFLEKCLHSILTKTDYPNYEIILLDNGSKEKRTKRFIDSIKDPRVRIYDFSFSFNWSLINNFGVDQANGEYILFLNDDIEVIENSWITEMVGFAAMKDVGCVGARLLYGNGTIQHVGVFVGPNLAGHYDRFKPVNNAGYYGLDQVTHEAIAVTGACMMVRKELFISLGRLDGRFRVCYGDVDFGIESYIQGYRNVVCMTATLFHHESVTRGAMQQGDDKHREMLKEMDLLQHKRGILYDPYWNMNADYGKGHDSVTWPAIPFGWEKEEQDKEWVVAINATDPDIAILKNKNYRVINILFFGGVAKVEFPVMYNFKPWDAFTNFNDLLKFVNKFNYTKTYFFGIKTSTLELLGYVSKLFKNIINSTSLAELSCPRGTGLYPDGTKCDNAEFDYAHVNQRLCNKCIDEHGTPYGFVNPYEWDKKWLHFEDTIRGVAVLSKKEK
jgi:GT2 family glycosyltransferase